MKRVLRGGSKRLKKVFVRLCRWALCFGFLLVTGQGYGADPSSFKIPAYEKGRLRNGLTVFLMERHEVPLIHLSLVFPGGSAMDGAKSGLAYLTLENLMAGTGRYGKKELEGRLESLGVSFDTYIDPDSARLDLSFLSTAQDQVLSILREVIRKTAFPTTEWEKRKKRLLLELEQEKERPAEVIDAYFRKFLFGSHGYGNPLFGTPSSVKKIASGGGAAFFRSHYRPEISALVIVGDFRTAVMKEKVRTYFEGWRVKKGSSFVKPPPRPPSSENRVLLVNKKDAQETQILIGALGLPWNHPDYVAVKVVNTVLGGRFSSWLNETLRVQGGLTYDIESYFEPYKTSGTFVIRSFTAVDQTVRAVDLILETLQRLQREGVDSETLDSTKRYLIGQFPSGFQTLADWAGLLGDLFIYGLDDAHINEFAERVERVTPERSRQVVATHFPREGWRFVFIGPADRLRDQVRKYGRLWEKDIQDDGF